MIIHINSDYVKAFLSYGVWCLGRFRTYFPSHPKLEQPDKPGERECEVRLFLLGTVGKSVLCFLFPHLTRASGGAVFCVCDLIKML